MKLIFSTDVRNYSNIKFNKNSASGSQVVHADGWTDKQKYRHNEVKTLFAILGTRLKTDSTGP
jgi:hypothetical protein